MKNSIIRRETKIANLRDKIKIGSKYPISIQSMLNVDSEDISANIKQAKELKNIGCEILRISVPNKNSVKTVYELKSAIEQIPLVADIHFDYRLALEAIHAGADKIRINPGNIGSNDNVEKIVSLCKSKNIPIRVGVNSGSIEKHILAKYQGPTAEALYESAMYHVKLIESFDYNNIVVSLKSSNVVTMVRAYELIAQNCTYPLHLGVTESGTENMGVIKSSVGIGSLLLKGIGDTIRVSLTADPKKEIIAAQNLLLALGIRKDGINIISCPTCGRTKIDLVKLANEVENRTRDCKKNITVAIMGCVVNGPGEAREADIGVAGGLNEGLIFKKGKILRKVPENKLVDELIKEIMVLDIDK